MQQLLKSEGEGEKYTTSKEDDYVKSLSKEGVDGYLNLVLESLASAEGRKDFLHHMSLNSTTKNTVYTSEFFIALCDFKFEKRPIARMRAAKCGEIFSRFLKEDSCRDRMDVALKIFKVITIISSNIHWH
jgi:hypothetical protein